MELFKLTAPPVSESDLKKIQKRQMKKGVWQTEGYGNIQVEFTKGYQELDAFLFWVKQDSLGKGRSSICEVK